MFKILKNLWERFRQILSNDIGIDLGTANTLVYIRGKGLVINEPSIVALNKKTGQVVAVGAQAKEMLGRTPAHIEAIKPLIDGVISDFEVAEEMLTYLMGRAQKDSKKLLGPRVVIGVPSNITNVQIRAVRDAARNAGARNVYIVEETMAAAIGIKLPVYKPIGSMVIDIGGGTTDVTLFIEGAISHSVVIPIGGKNITNDLAIGLRSSLEVAEKIKVSLSEQKKKMVGGDERENKERSDVLDISKLGINEDLGTLSKKTLLDGIIKPRLTEIFTLIGMEIKRSGYAGLLPSGLVITGGGAKTIGIESIGKDVLRMPVRVAEPTGVSGIIDEVSSPEFASSIGLILYGTKVSEESSGISLPSIRGGFNITGFLKRLLTWVRSFLP